MRGGHDRKFLGRPGGNARAVLFSRGVSLAPAGSVEDRLMLEMVFRERQEKVAHMDAIGKMIARVFNTDSNKAFGAIVSEYASEVFQESYDADLLRRKIEARRRAVASVRARRQRDLDLIDRMEKMGEWADMQLAAEKNQKKNK